jgi:hypothetical protein
MFRFLHSLSTVSYSIFSVEHYGEYGRTLNIVQVKTNADYQSEMKLFNIHYRTLISLSAPKGEIVASWHCTIKPLCHKRCQHNYGRTKLSFRAALLFLSCKLILHRCCFSNFFARVLGRLFVLELRAGRHVFDSW